jgi:hypothetical protein
LLIFTNLVRVEIASQYFYFSLSTPCSSLSISALSLPLFLPNLLHPPPPPPGSNVRADQAGDLTSRGALAAALAAVQVKPDPADALAAEKYNQAGALLQTRALPQAVFEVCGFDANAGVGVGGWVGGWGRRWGTNHAPMDRQRKIYFQSLQCSPAHHTSLFLGGSISDDGFHCFFAL